MNHEESPPTKLWGKKTLIAVIASGLIAALAAGGGTYAYQRSQNSKVASGLQDELDGLKSQLASAPRASATPTITATPEPSSTSTPASTPIPLTSSVTGTIKQLSVDLGLIDTADLDSPTGGAKPAVVYYSAGTYGSGAYAGYSRIIAMRPANGPGGPIYYQFATKDNVSYVLDGDLAAANSLGKDEIDSPYYEVNTKKITTVARLASDFPASISLSGNYGLFRYDGYRGEGDMDPVADLSTGMLVTDFSAYTKLALTGSALTLYAAAPQPSSEANDPYNTYVATSSKVVAVDTTGLAVSYVYATADSIKGYAAKVTAYQAAMVAYNKTNKTAKSPVAPDFPSVSLKPADITGAGTTPLFTSYDKALPRACASDSSTVIMKNLADTDLTAVGTYRGATVYTLKDSSSPLIKLSYDGKMANLDGDLFKQVNPDFSVKPTLAQYAANHPLLFVKDFWGRLLGLGEYDYKLLGGCGKPVVYLYPAAPTKVSVSFLSPMNLTTSIPSYRAGWEVLAQPDGVLTDMQPQYTNCSAIDTKKKGSEYAAGACATKTYPYLYWAGRSLQREYPTPTGGWVVAAADLSSTLNQKLDQLGLTAKEKGDMLSYWLPELQSVRAPYYRVSFLQTAEMNSIAPMSVVPTPDSLLRIFLDWAPLQEKPAQDLKPQVLKSFSRSGFAVVEWGGLKRSAE